MTSDFLRTGFWRVWLVTFLALLALGGSWILATPRSAPPDEAVQVLRAYAIVHGQIIGSRPDIPQPEAVTAVRAPESLEELEQYSVCFEGKPGVPAGCSATTSRSGHLATTLIYVGRYPPLYYVLVGLPTLVTHSLDAVYPVRLASLMLSAIFLAFAFAAGWRWSASRMLVPALAVAVTPMAIYMAAAVNPSGLEIAVAICLWTSLLVLVADQTVDPPKLLIAGAGISAVTLPLLRGFSPFFLVLIGLVILPLAWRNERLGLLRRRDVRCWLGLTVVSGMAAGLWILLAKSLNFLPGNQLPPHTTTSHMVSIIVGETSGYIQQYIGVFGALEVPSPLLTLLAWTGAASVLVFLAFSVGSRVSTVCLATTMSITLALPVAIGVSQARGLGLIGQGRYYLPFAAGVPILAGVLARPGLLIGSASRRLGRLLIGAVGAGHVAAFYASSHRYLVGAGGPLNPLARVPSGWAPPVPPAVLEGLGVVAIGLYAAWVMSLVSTGHPEGSSTAGVEGTTEIPDGRSELAIERA